jgi:quaternary ammonium compound-resistance protein SugE
MSGTARLFHKEPKMAWIMLLIAGLLEVVWAFSMKQSHGFTRLVPTIVTLVTMVASFALLSFSMRSLPLGTAYTIWTGIGAVGAFLVGILVLDEQVSAMRVLAAILIVAGLALMKLSSAH